MHYTLEAREDDCLQNHTVHVSIRVCRPFTKGGCAHGIRGEGEATRKAPEVDIQLVLPSFGWGRDGELLRVGRGLQGDRGREAQRGAAAGSYCAAGLKTH